jgi:hypothetical protein
MRDIGLGKIDTVLFTELKCCPAPERLPEHFSSPSAMPATWCLKTEIDTASPYRGLVLRSDGSPSSSAR